MASYIGLKAWDMGFDAHLTLIYTGKMSADREARTRFEMERVTKGLNYTFQALRRNIQMFGPLYNIPVLTVQPDQGLLILMKQLQLHIPSKSQYKWNPHITLNLDSSETINLPHIIKLDRLNIY